MYFIFDPSISRCAAADAVKAVGYNFVYIYIVNSVLRSKCISLRQFSDITVSRCAAADAVKAVGYNCVYL